MTRGSLLERLASSPAKKRALDLVPVTLSAAESASEEKNQRLEQEVQRHKTRMAVSMWNESHNRLMLKKITEQHDELLEHSRQLRAELALAQSQVEDAKAGARAEVDKANATIRHANRALFR